MGLKWGKPLNVKGGKVLLSISAFPSDSADAEILWTLWNLGDKIKTEIKSDGFRVSRNNKSKKWQITYWHNINENSFEKTVDDIPMWRHDLDIKTAKWKAKIDCIRETMIMAEEQLFESGSTST